MEEKRKGKSPLLYIQQPNFVEPEFPMQRSYSSDQQVATKTENKTASPTKQKSSIPFQAQTDLDEHIAPAKKIANQAEKPKSAVDYFRSQANTGKKSWSLTPVKAFKEMSITEKIQYLTQVPRTQPPFPCEFIKENERIRGILQDSEEDQIQVRTFNGDICSIAIKELQTIRIIF